MIQKMILVISGEVQSPGKMLSAVYTLPDGKDRILYTPTDFADFAPGAKDNPKPLMFMFNKKNGQHEFSFDPDSKDPYEVKRTDVVNTFWKQHPLLTVNGKSTAFTKIAHFDMFSERERRYESFADMDTFVNVATRLKTMNADRLRDVMYFYGQNPGSMTREEMIVTLANQETGYATLDNDRRTGENLFLKVWQEESVTDKEFIVNMHKAISYGIVELRKEGSRDIYYYGHDFIGHATSDVLAFLKREEKLYNGNILPRINEADINMFGAPEKQKAGAPPIVPPSGPPVVPPPIDKKKKEEQVDLT